MAGPVVEPRVTLGELGVDVHDLNGFGSKVGPDWKGEPSLSLTDAAAFARERQEATEAHEAAWRAHQADNERWLAGRVAAGRAAAGKVREGRRPTPGVWAAAQSAWLEAAFAWQGQNPRPKWNGAPTLPDGLLIAEADLGVYHAGDDDHMWREVH